MHKSLTAYDSAIREDFPFLKRRINGKPIIYFDNAATTQKPQCVIDALCDYYTNHCANIHRGAHVLTEESSELYEAARDKVARFLRCEAREIVFVRNATEGINLVSRCLARRGDVLVPLSEHHSNLLPWRQDRTVRHVAITRDGRIDLDDLRRQLDPEAALVAFSHVGNVLGAVNPVRDVVQLANVCGALTLLDASQSVAHLPLDVKALGCDFLVFSGHKMFAPTGIGVLYGRWDCLDDLRPYLVGGGAVKEVSLDGYLARDLPARFEAGTPNIEGAIALGAAIDYVEELGLDWIAAHEQRLLQHVLAELRVIPGFAVYGPDSIEGRPCGPIAFGMRKLDSHALARILGDRENVMVRSGHHCAQPLHQALSLPPMLRASFSVYNTIAELDVMVDLLSTLARYV
jgi:cysteine desulfurase/selenocysteine lyase